MTFRPSYEGFHFHAIYDDGNSGMISSPGEWNVGLMAVVPDDKIDQWIECNLRSGSGLDSLYPCKYYGPHRS